MKTGWKMAFTSIALAVVCLVAFYRIALPKTECCICDAKCRSIDMSNVNLDRGNKIKVCPRCSCAIFGASLSLHNQN
jgi:hypothetical protein